MSTAQYIFIGRFVRCLLVMLVAAVPSQATATEYTLESAVTQALAANPGVEAKFLAIEQARMGVGVAQSSFWPRVSLYARREKLKNSGAVGSSDDMTSTTTRSGVDVTLSLFAGFAHLNELERSRLSVDVSAAQHRQARLELIMNVQTSFMGLMSAREEQKLVNDSMRRIETQLKASEAFVRLEMTPYVNVLQNRVELSQAKQAGIRVENDMRNFTVQLHRLLGLSPNENASYTGDARTYGSGVALSEEEAIHQAMKGRPDLDVAAKSIAVAVKEADITAGDFLPKVDLTYSNGKMDRDYQDMLYTDYERRFNSIQLSFTWDIFEGGRSNFAYRGDRKRIQSLTKDYEDALIAAKTEVIRSLLDIAAAREMIAVSRQGVAAAQESYAMASKRYTTHIGTVTELIDAQSRLTEAEVAMSQAWGGYQTARIRFFYSIGRENPSLL